MNSFFKIFCFVILFLDCFLLKANLQEIISTNYTCANTLAELNCPKEYSIFISRIEYKYTSGQCIDYDDANNYLSANSDDLSVDDCIGIDSHNEYFTSRCNGQQNCFVEVKKRTHKTGFSGTNCDFESNMANIFYACIPNNIKEPFKSFSICDPNGPDTILGLENGFIHSPYFPDYYGNNHDCYVNVGVPKNKRLVIYLLKMNLEGYGMFREPKDYFVVDNGPKLYGSAILPHIVYNSSDREKVHIKFRSDWITTTKLSYPKGFLVFFALYTVNQQTITTTTTTTTTETTTTQDLKAHFISLSSSTINAKSNESFISAISQRREKELQHLKDDNDRTPTIITILVSLIGLLIVIIFGLLFMFRNKQIQRDEEDIYVEDKSINTASNNDYKDIKSDPTSSINKLTFSSRLTSIYKRINQTLHKSNDIINNVNPDKEINKQDIEQSELKIKSFDVNEFNPNVTDDKFEKSIPIDSLKLFQKDVKKSNIELEQQRNIRNENPYVVNATGLKNVSDEENLKIFEVNFDNNLAYMTTDEKKLKKETKVYVDSNTEIYQSIKELDTDKEDEDCDGLITNDELNEKHEKDLNETIVAGCQSQKSEKKLVDDESSSIYSTPTNIRIVDHTLTPSNQNSSKIYLLNESTNEADA